MNKVIVTQPHFVMTVVGPSGCGKTRLVSELLKNNQQVFRPNFDNMIYFYQHWQPTYDSILNSLGNDRISFINGVSWSKPKSLPIRKRHLIIFDDVFDEISRSEEFLNLIVSGRHKNQHVIFLKHNLYQKCPNSKTIDLNLTHILLLKSPRDINQIDYLGRQLGCRSDLLSAYRSATSENFGHLLIDLDPQCHENLRFCSGLCRQTPTVFYLNSKTPDFVSLDGTFTESEYFETAYNP